MLRSGRNFYYLRRRAPPRLVSAINALGEPGLALEREPDRLYPQTSLAAHVVGFTDLDGKGNAGIERAFDERLRDPAQRGQPIVLSISSRVQQALEHELGNALATFSAIGAAGVVMDIHTGEVLAMTSLPQLNPNDAGDGTPEARFNRATLGVYELGSTFKPFTVAMAMDSGIIKSMGQIYPCPGLLNAYGHQIHAGLSARMRLFLEFAIAGIATWLMVRLSGTHLYLPFVQGAVIDISWAYIPFGAFVIVAFGNSVNLTDGLDGLATMPDRLAEAHLIIARAGASTIAELTAAGRPAILVPLPIATDDHQTVNAREMARAGGARMIPQDEFTPEVLAAQIEAVAGDPQALGNAAERALSVGRPHATRELADLVERIAGGAKPLMVGRAQPPARQAPSMGVPA